MNLQLTGIDAGTEFCGKAGIGPPQPLIHPNLAEIYRTKIENLPSLLDDPECKTEAFDIIRGLIDDVRLVPEKGNLSVEL